MSESTVETSAKKGRGPKGRPTPKARDSHAAAYEAYRKAKIQWYAIAAVVGLAIIAAIVLLSIYTDANAPAQV